MRSSTRIVPGFTIRTTCHPARTRDSTSPGNPLLEHEYSAVAVQQLSDQDGRILPLVRSRVQDDDVPIEEQRDRARPCSPCRPRAPSRPSARDRALRSRPASWREGGAEAGDVIGKVQRQPPRRGKARRPQRAAGRTLSRDLATNHRTPSAADTDKRKLQQRQLFSAATRNPQGHRRSACRTGSARRAGHPTALQPTAVERARVSPSSAHANPTAASGNSSSRYR